MWTCGHCLTGGKECKVSDNCDKCEACVWLGISCDLYISSEEINKVSEEINKVSEKILQLEKEKDAVTAQKQEMKMKKERLCKQIAFLKKHWLELIRTELQNIEELEAEEQVTAGPSNRPPLDFLTPEAFSLDDADWLPADFFAGTGAVLPHNEWDSLLIPMCFLHYHILFTWSDSVTHHLYLAGLGFLQPQTRRLDFPGQSLADFLVLAFPDLLVQVAIHEIPDVFT